MTAAQKELMLRYIALYKEEGVNMDGGCDICLVNRLGKPLPTWLDAVFPNKKEGYGCRPNLCLDHGRELGVVW